MNTASRKIVKGLLKQGGAGSGFFGHAGRPGQRGGSSSEGGSAEESGPKLPGGMDKKIAEFDELAKPVAKINDVVTKSYDKMRELRTALSARAYDRVVTRAVKVGLPLDKKAEEILAYSAKMSERANALLEKMEDMKTELEDAAGKNPELAAKIERFGKAAERLKSFESAVYNKLDEVAKKHGMAAEIWTD